MVHFLTSVFQQPPLSSEELAIVIPSFTQTSFAKNDFILLEGQTNTSYYFLESGFIRSFAIDEEGNDITTGFVSAGEIVWEPASLFLQMTSKENIQALEDCVCWKIDFGKFQELFNSLENFRDNGRARLTQAFFQHKMRSLSMITDSAEQRYNMLMKQHPLIIQRAPLKHIATYLGITDTSLSRIRKKISQS